MTAPKPDLAAAARALNALVERMQATIARWVEPGGIQACVAPLLVLTLLAACATARPVPGAEPVPDAGHVWPVGSWRGSGCVDLLPDAGLGLVPCQVRR